ncbi:MAG: crosslink repair DNA glycosylase YcaQ family protein [Ignavibacteria bacterium]
MKNIEISIEDARNLALSRQLLFRGKSNSPKKKLLNIIEQLGYVQIDTISIVERAHKHVLWTRLPEYKNEMLDQLIDKDKMVFEFWDHAAAYMPMKHFRFTLPRKEMYSKKYKHWADKNKKLLKFILERITNEGPLQSRNFDEPAKRGVWWDWKPAKDGLEFLFHTGKLVAKARKNFQKVYELPERFLPSDLNTSFPNDEELSEHLILKSINSNGLSSEKELTYLRLHNRTSTKNTLYRLIEEKKIVPLHVNGIDEDVYYSTNKNLNSLESFEQEKSVQILSPFDNIVIQRKRLNTLFGFDYIIECYVPAPKRKFGYFCLPVVYGNRFVAKIDTKADRKSGEFRIINEFREKDFKSTTDFEEKLQIKLLQLAEFSGCKTIKK